MNPVDPISFCILSAGVFAGAVVSGLVGFAFSAVAGAILLHMMPPAEAVPLMMACSTITQAASLVALRGKVKWRGSPFLILGGAFGIVPALYLLHQIDAQIIRLGFGVFLTAYAACMLLRPTTVRWQDSPSSFRHVIVGFGGGLVGGLTAMPGALPTIWCDLRGLPKDQQRAEVQPYIAAMQLFALAILLPQQGFSKQTLFSLALTLPALAAGVALGIVLFRRVNNAQFRSVVLLVLLFAGLLLAGLTAR